MGESESHDVVIVGAGVIGCAAARALAPDHEVCVLDAGQVAGGATALSAGEVTMTPSYSDHPEVAAHANEFFRSYSGTGEFTFEERPSYELVLDGRESVARRRVDRLRGEGLDVSFLSAEELRSRQPRFRAEEVDGAVRHEDTGFVDPYTLAVTLQRDAEREGAVFHPNTAVESVLVAGDDDDGDRDEGSDGGGGSDAAREPSDDGDRGVVVGVATESDEHRAPVVVVAVGWRTEQFLRGTLQVPVRPYRTQVVVLDPEESLPDGFPMGWIPGEHVYFRPELNGDLLVGGWSFAEDDPEGASGDADEAFRQHVADLLPRFFAGFDRAGYVDGWAGVDGATPDTRPIVDRPDAGPAGLVVATGFHGRGVMTAPVAATLVRSHVTDESTALPADIFALDRFDSRTPDFEFTSISSGDDDYDGD